MNVVVPMAGRGTRFATQGVDTPKPLIPVAGRPMIAWALQSLDDVAYSQVIFVVLAEHERQYGVTSMLRRLIGERAEVVLLPDVTEGQLCTVLAARSFIDSHEDLLIASADTYVRSSLGRDIAARAPDCRGLISVAEMPGERWSFARTDPHGRVVEVAEKVRISSHVSTGLYYFARGHEFCAVADDMIRKGEKTRGEYYVIPMYRKYIERRWRVDISRAHAMWDMGTPEALWHFEQHLAGLDSVR